ncbi:homogentisate 1,2-dioxygenase [Aspergillus terreus NIH2624]|uniref:homogentisate 1,2-dioxygenase n=1 Tax=Aspergillus terreus (strain NIH 2624 / FGSC A1156) TaxID=341663 RepID=Q0CRR6_ASPTN|nr:homogentisate 1,2-dioxygenase [Aspergillus terreus NIH2624]EAU35420.1 homogentisate 1,2-dioxygenase [Aspergillus terreus NIH2624]
MPVTKFDFPEKYEYLVGFGVYHHSEALPGANPVGQNAPQVAPYKLLIERITNSSFTTPRALNCQSWIYREKAASERGPFSPYKTKASSPSGFQGPRAMTPNTFKWGDFEMESGLDWVSAQKLVCQAGSIPTKTGLGYMVYGATENMPPNTVYTSSDGEYLIIPQAGVLDIRTEFGNMLVRPNEIAVIPRGIKYRVDLPAGPARGYICEIYQGHYQLPELGTIGSTGLANARDFQVPKAVFDGTVKDGVATCSPADWTVINKYNGDLFSSVQDHTPFDVAGWHGTCYPYKYDLGRFSPLGSLLYDHPDPSLFTVLTVPSRREPLTAVVEFCLIPPRWQVMENTYWLPPYHLNTMSEFMGFINKHPDPSQDLVFKPFGGMLTGAMNPHGAERKEHEAETKKEFKPTKVGTEPFTPFLLESEAMMGMSEWGLKTATQY